MSNPQEQTKASEDSLKKNLAQLGALEDDDEFEEFAAEGKEKEEVEGVFFYSRCKTKVSVF
jgi:26 proteasome complex subunit DSS1